MPKVDIESSWDRLGVELWPNYYFETPNYPWGWLQWGVSDARRSHSHSHSQASGPSRVFCKWVVLEHPTGASEVLLTCLAPLEPTFPEPPRTPSWNHLRTTPEPPQRHPRTTQTLPDPPRPSPTLTDPPRPSPEPPPNLPRTCPELPPNHPRTSPDPRPNS